MALRVFGDDAASFSLRDENDVEIGWIEGRALGFRCFADLDDAMAAARVAYETLVSWSARLGASRANVQIGDAELQVVNDGAYEWFASDRIPVARLLRPRADVALDRGLYGIELVIPQGIGAVAAIGGAQVIHSALVRQLPDVLAHANANQHATQQVSRVISQESNSDTYANDNATDLAQA